MAGFDLLIRGGTVVDGTGRPARTADVAVADGEIVAVGRLEGVGANRTVDADGALVMPGFVDIHTHYDGLVTWDQQITPSSWLGVTTVVMGNCGVGFAPCRPEDRDRIVELMEGVEDIPGTALHDGLPWSWTSFPEYLDFLDTRTFDIDVAAQVPHGAVRLFVMGERGARGEAATPEDIDTMGTAVREAIAAGALGFTTSRTTNHRTSRGEPTPTLRASGAELAGIATSMRDVGGVLEVVADFDDLDAEFGMLRRMVEVSGRPLTISVAAEDHRVPWQLLREQIHRAAASELPIKGQVGSRAIGLLLGLEASLHPLIGVPAYRDIATRPLAERVAVMRNATFRNRVLDEIEGGAGLLFDTARTFLLGDPPDYEPAAADSVAARAAAAGTSAATLLYDLLLDRDGTALLYFPLFNWTGGNLDAVGEMLADEHLLPGLGDGGAHVGTICDASYPTTLLSYWARDRRDGLPLEWVVKRQCRDTAAAVGLCDRGVLAPGYRADLLVVDFDALRLQPPFMAYDLPAGGKRLLQRAHGYRHTFVNGVETYADGAHSGAFPGRLVRRPRHAPDATGAGR
ncbi:MAG: N-acyl-D-amino-acid deacylase family protein [Acidimicrobiales bacterium]